MEDVILTPIYNGTSYKHHECSNCKKEIYFEESILVPFRFEEKIKYCPFCGRKVIRYGKPRYEELPNWDWMDKFKEILDNTDEKIEYEIFCKMNREEQKELIEKAEYGIEYFGSSSDWNDNTNICKIVRDVAYRKPHHSYIKKLENQFLEK